MITLHFLSPVHVLLLVIVAGSGCGSYSAQNFNQHKSRDEILSVERIDSKDEFAEALFAGPSIYFDRYSYEGYDDTYHYAANPSNGHVICIRRDIVSREDVAGLLREQKEMIESKTSKDDIIPQASNGVQALAVSDWLKFHELDGSLYDEIWE